MGFFDGLRRMIEGKPVFVDENKEAQAQDASESDDPWRQDEQPATEESHLVDERGRKIIPEIRLEHCKSHLNGSTIMVTAWVTNMGQVEVELYKVEMLDMKYELDRFLKPGQAHEVILYNGPIPQDESDHKAVLEYKIVENGDYFDAEFMIEYGLESNGVYIIKELHPNPVIRDV